MSRTIYYLGAGASYGRRNDEKKIVEGLPVVAEIPKQFDLFRTYIENAEIPTDKEFVFQQTYRTTATNVDSSKRDMLHDIDALLKGIQEHATIDTYARKLYLTGRKREFQKLKSVLCAFFVWAQLQYKPDGRYDTFLANILEEGSLGLPNDISIISWNYDSQIELAYRAYNPDNRLPIFEKNLQGDWPQMTNNGRIIKINGSATFEDKSTIQYIKNDEATMPEALQLMEFYHDSQVDTSEMGLDFKTHLSFAWEDSPNRERIIGALIKTTENTEYVVVIGYSFPFFNRVTDKAIFSGMKKLKKVYIQDINPHAVKESIQAVLPAGYQIEIVPISNCEQFYLPSEL